MTRTYSRDDVETHYGEDRPAVNVKVYDSLADGYRKFREYEPDADEGFTLEWIEEAFSDEYLGDLFWLVCGGEYEYLAAWATGQNGDPLFPGDRVELEQDGRSGGWVVVTGLPDLCEWDAIRLARWRKFERIARSIADDVMYQLVSSLFINEWEARKVEDVEQERAANQDIATA